MREPLCIGVAPAVNRIEVLSSLQLGAANRVNRTILWPAGKAINSALALRRLGYKPTVAGLCGGALGSYLHAQLVAAGVVDAMVRTEAETRLCTTLCIPAGATEIVEESAPCTTAERDQFIANTCARIPQASIVLLTGSCPAFIGADAYGRFAEVAQKAHVPLVVDSHGDALLRTLPFAPILVKINRQELQQSARSEEVLLAQGAQAVLVTEGTRESVLSTVEGRWRFRPVSVQEVNAIGAGDATNAGFIDAYLRGVKDLLPAIKFALGCATASVKHLEPSVFSLDEVEYYYPEVIA